MSVRKSIEAAQGRVGWSRLRPLAWWRSASVEENTLHLGELSRSHRAAVGGCVRHLCFGPGLRCDARPPAPAPAGDRARGKREEEAEIRVERRDVR